MTNESPQQRYRRRRRARKLCIQCGRKAKIGTRCKACRRKNAAQQRSRSGSRPYDPKTGVGRRPLD